MYRVLVLTSTFPRWENDTEPRFVLDLCKHLSRHAEVRVVAPHAPGAAFEESIDGVRVSRFRYFVTDWQSLTYSGGIMARIRENAFRAVQLPFLLVGLYGAASRLISQWKPDVIHAHWIVPQAVIACMAARGRIPIVCTSHGGDLFGLQGPVFKRIKAWTLKRCQGVTVVSKSMVAPVHRLVPDVQVSVVPMGTDVTALFTPPRPTDARSRNQITFVGRLVEKKGLQHLIDALARLRQQGIDVKLTIVGEGPLKRQLQRQVLTLGLGVDVRFAGSVQHIDLPDIYRKSALAVFPFVVAESGDQEGFGLVVTEAMACGCPVLASDLPAIRDSVEQGVTGVLVRPGDSIALAQAIQQMLENESQCSKIADAALEIVRKRFDWSIIAARYSETLQNCIT